MRDLGLLWTIFGSSCGFFVMFAIPGSTLLWRDGPRERLLGAPRPTASNLLRPAPACVGLLGKFSCWLDWHADCLVTSAIVGYGAVSRCRRLVMWPGRGYEEARTLATCGGWVLVGGGGAICGFCILLALGIV